MHTRHLHLGASLYVPATRGDIVAHANGDKLNFLRSMIFCTEDAVRQEDLELALRNLAEALPQFNPKSPSMRFIRVRNQHVLGRLLETRGIENVDGFVLPKVTAKNFGHYLSLLNPRDKFLLMPTLETAEVYDPVEMRTLRDMFMETGTRARILSLRIGGNDLLHCLGVRRPPNRTIYSTALGGTIAMLTGLFKPHGFNLSSPVFEAMKQPRVLAREVARDLLHGLFGKTAIHPDQVKPIEDAYRVWAHDLEAAQCILSKDAPAVFKLHDCMCEGATQWRWAEQIVARSRIYGMRIGREHQNVHQVQVGKRERKVVSLHQVDAHVDTPADTVQVERATA